MNKKLLNTIKFLITIAIVCSFVWFLVISPMITFKKYENTFKEAAERYYELNSNKLPTGERVKTLSLNALYKESYLKEDFYVPYSKKPCSLEKSWVKVKKNKNGEYEYFVYLQCGTIKSNIDHEGPVIKLKGETTIKVDVGNEFKDPGVESVRDAVDGKLNNDIVTVRSDVDTNKIGTYEVKYTAYDSLNNKSTVTRTVEVVKTLKSIVKKDLGEKTNYVGEPLNNFIRLSNMYFRIFGLTEDGNIIVVSDEDLAYVSFDKVEKWLDDYFYDYLNDFTKKNIVESKFCNMTVDEASTNTTECTQYTKKRKMHIPSIIEVNKAADGTINPDGITTNFLRPETISWIANAKDESEAYITRNRFYGLDNMYKTFMPFDRTHNYGIKPMFVIKGDMLVKNGEGTVEKPYEFGDTKKVKFGTKLSERETGEFVSISGVLYRIIGVTKEGTTRVVSMSSFGINNHDEIEVYSNYGMDNLVYDPTNKKNVGYYINNGAMEYIDTRNFVNHEIEVPIYKDKLIYGTEVETKKYNVKLAAPNIFELFGASGRNYGHLYVIDSYWILNGSKNNRMGGAVTDIGVPLNEEITPFSRFGIRVVGQINAKRVIVSGKGTYFSPYIIN